MWTVAHFHTRDFLFFQSPNPFILLLSFLPHFLPLFGCHLPPSWALLFEDVCLLYLRTYTPFSLTLDTHKDDTSWPFWPCPPTPTPVSISFTDFRDPHPTSESSARHHSNGIWNQTGICFFSNTVFHVSSSLSTAYGNNCSSSVLVVHHSWQLPCTHLPFLLPSHSPVETPICLNIYQHQRY